MSNYDSTQDTLYHIKTVQNNLLKLQIHLMARAMSHDQSKLESPEKELFDKYTPLLRETTYGSAQYKQYLAEMGEALEHHYKVNSHHPEHYPNGIDDMSLLDVIEMFADWKAASERHANGNMEESLKINTIRFKLSPQLLKIFRNTLQELEW